MKINWTPRAERTFEKIIIWLLKHWTAKEVKNFISDTEKTIEQIQQNPYMYKASTKNKQVRKGLINRLISMFYKVRPRKKEIDIIAFWDNRQDPEKNTLD